MRRFSRTSTFCFPATDQANASTWATATYSSRGISRPSSRRDSADASTKLVELAETLNVATTEGSGLLEIPDVTNARGLREAGVLPDAGPGLGETTAGYDAEHKAWWAKNDDGAHYRYFTESAEAAA